MKKYSKSFFRKFLYLKFSTINITSNERLNNKTVKLLKGSPATNKTNNIKTHRESPTGRDKRYRFIKSNLFLNKNIKIDPRIPIYNKKIN